MGKKTKVEVDGNSISGPLEDVIDVLKKAVQKPYEITSASIKEQKCNYGYEIKTGPTAGDKIPTRKGEAIIHDDMTDAFTELKVHLAVADDAFKHLFPELPEMKKLKAHKVIDDFTVTGFKVTGSEEDEGYVINGEKWVSLGVMSIDTPKIGKGSNYKFFEDLKDAIAKAREEVELYMNGKCTPKEDDEEKVDPNQLKLEFELSANEFDEEE